MVEGDPPSEPAAVIIVNGTGTSEEKPELVSPVKDADGNGAKASEGEVKTIPDEMRTDEGEDQRTEDAVAIIVTNAQDGKIVVDEGQELVDDDNNLDMGNLPDDISKEVEDRKMEDAESRVLVADDSKLDARNISEEVNTGVSDDGKTEKADSSIPTETQKGEIKEAFGQVLGTNESKLVVGNIPDEISKDEGEDAKREEVDTSIKNEGQEGNIVETESGVLAVDDSKLDVDNVPLDEISKVEVEIIKEEVDASILTEDQEGKIVEAAGQVVETAYGKVDVGAKDGKTKAAEIEKTNDDQDSKSFKVEKVTNINVVFVEGVEVNEAESGKIRGVEGEKPIESADSMETETDGFPMVGAKCIRSTEPEVREIVVSSDSNAKDSKDAKFTLDEEPVIMNIDDSKELDAEELKPTEAEIAKATEAENIEKAEDESRNIEDEGDEKLAGDDDVKMDEADAVNIGVSEEMGAEVEATVSKVQEEAASTMEHDIASTEQKTDEIKMVKPSNRKRSSGPKIEDEGEHEAKEENKDVEGLYTLLASPTNRPMRERKTVERLVEVIDKGSSREFLIEKGRGTALKDIPNVAHKLSKKKPGDLKFLHQTLFGRRGKAINFKNHLLQFSGFVWHENEEKQRTKIKEKLDKCVKDALIDICNLFDIPVSKTSSRKEELIVKLLDFMAAPYAANDAVVSEEQSSSRSKKRKRVSEGSTAHSTESPPSTGPRKKRMGSVEKHRYKGKAIEESNDEDDENSEDEGRESSENGFQDDKEEAYKHSESDTKESNSEETGEEEYDTEDYEDSGRRKKNSKKRSKQGNSLRVEKSKLASSRGVVSPSAIPTTKGSQRSARTVKPTKNEKTSDAGEKVFSRKRKVELPKKTTKPATKAKFTGKSATKGKSKSEDVKESGPSKTDLRTTICEILKEVDFSTATFTDILKQLAEHYNMDLSSRKKTIKLMIQEELTKLADEAEENEDEEDEGKEGAPLPKGKAVEA